MWKIREFEWDEGNALHIQLGHGVLPEEAEEVFIGSPVLRKIRGGRYAAFGRTTEGRYLTIVFLNKGSGLVRIITGWDMTRKEKHYYQEQGR